MILLLKRKEVLNMETNRKEKVSLNPKMGTFHSMLTFCFFTMGLAAPQPAFSR